ncbi:uncharacterized protein [Dermacentor albipictus]|uniref:uncharacterized protein n=1 Tax=Dermacentor albipictus TaxID=60249 RepID=UPI0038FD3EC8
MDVVEVEGETISPEEYDDEGWIADHEHRSNVKRRPDLDERSKNIGDSPVSTAWKTTNARILQRPMAPRQPQLPEDDCKVVIRPRGGLDMAQQRIAYIKDGVLLAAASTPENAGEDTLRINPRQNTMIMSTPKLDNAKRYSQIREIQLGSNTYSTAAYITAPENTSKGVIHGIPEYDTSEDVEKSLVNCRNPTILHARRMGRTDSVVIVFKGTYVPHYVYYRRAEYRCLLYRKQYETCTTCGRLGHRADVCPTPNSKKCRGCGTLNPPEDHQCEPRCFMCGKGHLTGDKKCRERFKTPYLLRKRQWKQQQQQRNEHPPQKAMADNRPSRSSERSGSTESHKGSTRTNSHGSRHRDRSRSSSFPRLPGGGGGGQSHSKSRSRSRRRSESRSRGSPLHGTPEGSGGYDGNKTQGRKIQDRKQWETVLLSSAPEDQLLAVQQAEDAARAQGLLAAI